MSLNSNYKPPTLWERINMEQSLHNFGLIFTPLRNTIINSFKILL